MSETFDRWTDNRNEHEAGLMDPSPHYQGNEPSANQIDYERGQLEEDLFVLDETDDPCLSCSRRDDWHNCARCHDHDGYRGRAGFDKSGGACRNLCGHQMSPDCAGCPVYDDDDGDIWDEYEYWGV